VNTTANCDFSAPFSNRSGLRAVPPFRGLGSRACEGKEVTADNTSRNEIRPLFALVKLAPPLYKHYLYPIKLNISNKEPLIYACHVTTFSLEIIYSIITQASN
jgi:hypothetical protein